MRPATRSVNPSRYSSLARRSTVRDRSTRSTFSPLVPSGALRCLISNTSEFGTSDPRQPLLALVFLPFGQCPPWADGRWGWTEEAVCIFMARSARVEVFRFSRRVGDSNLFHISCPWEGCFSASQGRKGRESRALFFLRVLFCTKRKRDSHRRCGPPWLPPHSIAAGVHPFPGASLPVMMSLPPCPKAELPRDAVAVGALRVRTQVRTCGFPSGCGDPDGGRVAVPRGPKVVRRG